MMVIVGSPFLHEQIQTASDARVFVKEWTRRYPSPVAVNDVHMLLLCRIITCLSHSHSFSRALSLRVICMYTLPFAVHISAEKARTSPSGTWKTSLRGI